MKSVAIVRIRQQFGFILLLLTSSLLLRFYVFKNFYVFSNDDLYYADWLAFLQGSGDFALVDSIQMPPGYPIILLLESLVFKDLYKIKMFELVFLLSLLPLLCLVFLWKLKIEVDKPFMTLVFFVPFTIVGISTINISSEIWFLFFILFGIFLLIDFAETLKWSKLILASGLFSFSYLIRPEGLLYLTPIYLIIFHIFRDSVNRKNFNLVVILQILGIPVVTVISFMLSMHTYFGEFIITGKLKSNLVFAQEISDNPMIRMFENSVGLLRIFVAPMFLGPLLSTLMMSGAFRLFIKRKMSQLDFLVVVLPIILIGAINLFFYPMGRVLIVLCPALLYLGAIGWKSLTSILPNNAQVFTNFVFIAILVIQSTYPFALNRLHDSTRGYYLALESLEGRSNQLIFSREPTLTLQNASNRYCENLSLCNEIPEILLLSHSTRAKLTPITSIESSQDFPRVIFLGKDKYEKVDITNGRFEPVYTYIRRHS